MRETPGLPGSNMSPQYDQLYACSSPQLLSVLAHQCLCKTPAHPEVTSPVPVPVTVRELVLLSLAWNLIPKELLGKVFRTLAQDD